ncbi:LuxR C-terminal-related transcriptional regulator [Streptosporangium saharense]|uniref:LuxR C-terminal-related transcriptional regulator n=1 Tax=Streptosporangium saharense TaxID=1706840 RepID=UPI0033178E6E
MAGPEPLRVYRVVVERQRVTAEGVARELGAPVVEVKRALQELVRNELVREVPGGGGEHVAVPPGAAEARLLAPIQLIINDFEVQAEGIRAELAQFQEVHDEAVRGRHAEFRVLPDMDLINAEVARAAEGCRLEVMTAQSGGRRPAATLEGVWDQTVGMLKRGVKIRTIYQHTARFDQATRRYVERVCEWGGEVRTLEEFFERMIVFDREVAFIPAEGNRQVAVEVRQPAVLEFLIGVFERSWVRGRPFEGATSSSDVAALVGDIRLSIIRMLADGETDGAIARRMGMGVRTCRGHIAKIYESFGARSRCHLGVLISRSGLLE